MPVIGTITTTATTTLTLDLDFLRTRVARLLRRADINTEIEFWLNFAQRELCEEVDFPELRTDATPISLVAGTDAYNLPTDYARIDRAYYLESLASPNWGRVLTPMPRHFHHNLLVEEQVNTGTKTSGDPHNYFIQKDKIWLYPVPDKATTLQLRYYRLPNDMTLGTHVPDIGAQWRHYLIWLAYYYGQVFLEKSDNNKLLIWQGKAQTIIGHVKKMVNKKENPVFGPLPIITGLEDATRIY